MTDTIPNPWPFHWEIGVAKPAEYATFDSQGFVLPEKWPDWLDYFYIEGVPGLFPTELDAKAFRDVLMGKLGHEWIPIDIQPPKSSEYLVGHRGHCKKLHFFHPKDSWCAGTKLGWTDLHIRAIDPIAGWKATHWFLIPSCPPYEYATNRVAGFRV